MARRSTHSANSSSFTGRLTTFLLVVVAATVFAHQAGFISWDLEQAARQLGLPSLTQLNLPSLGGHAVGASQDSQAANCASQFLDGQEPALSNAKLSAETQKLCFEGFAVLHSGLTRTPLWSAEHLTAARIARAKTLARTDTFHADENLPPDQRAELDDYKGSDYDRGHMAPNGDMPDAASQEECFTLANIIPQDPDNNRGVWEEIESTVRTLAEKDGDIYVVTGPIFAGTNLQQLNGRVAVPTQIFKAVYDVKTGQASAYVVDNVAGRHYDVVTIADLEALTGIRVFPSLPEQTVSELKLPAPHSHHHG